MSMDCILMNFGPKQVEEVFKAVSCLIKVVYHHRDWPYSCCLHNVYFIYVVVKRKKYLIEELYFKLFLLCEGIFMFCLLNNVTIYEL